MKTVITDHPFPTLDASQAIFSRNGIDMDVLQTKDPETILARAKTADAMIVGMARIDKKIIDALERCKVIVRQGVGYDNVDVSAATARGIMVVNLPDVFTEEVADHAAAIYPHDCAEGAPRTKGREGWKMGAPWPSTLTDSNGSTN